MSGRVDKGDTAFLVKSTVDFGEIVKAKRREHGMTQRMVAGYSNTGVRFISDLENGKETVEMGKALAVLHGLGLDIYVVPRG